MDSVKIEKELEKIFLMSPSKQCDVHLTESLSDLPAHILWPLLALLHKLRGALLPLALGPLHRQEGGHVNTDLLLIQDGPDLRGPVTRRRRRCNDDRDQDGFVIRNGQTVLSDQSSWQTIIAVTVKSVGNYSSTIKTEEYLVVLSPPVSRCQMTDNDDDKD